LFTFPPLDKIGRDRRNLLNRNAKNVFAELRDISPMAGVIATRMQNERGAFFLFTIISLERDLLLQLNERAK